MRLSFELLARDHGHFRFHDDEHFRESLYNVAVIIHFGGVDGLGGSINRIVDRMQDDLAANAPHAIRAAAYDVIGATLTDVVARVRAGYVTVR